MIIAFKAYPRFVSAVVSKNSMIAGILIRGIEGIAKPSLKYLKTNLPN